MVAGPHRTVRGRESRWAASNAGRGLQGSADPRWHGAAREGPNNGWMSCRRVAYGSAIRGVLSTAYPAAGPTFVPPHPAPPSIPLQAGLSWRDISTKTVHLADLTSRDQTMVETAATPSLPSPSEEDPDDQICRICRCEGER